MTEAKTYSHVVEIKRRLKTIDTFLSSYSWLINSYTTDYFTMGLENKFPKAFSKFLLKDCTLDDLASLLPDWSSQESELRQPQKSFHARPLSLLAFKSLCQHLSLDQRVPERDEGNSVFGTSLEKYFRVCVKAKKRHEVDILAEVLSSLCKENGCEHVVDIGAGLGHLSRLLTFNKHLKVTTIEASDSHSPKAQRLDRRTETLMSKQKVANDVPVQPNHISHYIDSNITSEEFIHLLSENNSHLSSTGETVSQSHPAVSDAEQSYAATDDTNQRVVTAADKLSHLSERMAHLISLPTNADVHGTEAQLEWFDLPWAKELPAVDASLSLTYKKALTRYTPVANQHFSSLSSTSAPASSASVCPAMPSNSGSQDPSGTQTNNTHTKSPSNSSEKVCLSGLHTCGDLASTMVRVFTKLPCARVVSSIGCCYMKLSTQANGSPTGFPLSEYISSLANHRNVCTYEALEMGCHSLTQYRQRLLNSESSLRRHVIRATLQMLIYRRKRKEEIQFRRLKIRNSEQLSFREYAERAFKRLGLDYDVTENEIAECEKLIESHWKAVVGAYTVRLALAPLVEAYILLDRMLFLWEQGFSSQLIPLFDPLISPRNMALVAVKDN
ncbi:methyltransferase-like protein 25B isoform X1 [Watersipora subatra]|uniref:methyltransferase-like protein 25B isoform X1 n=1 Tax=Watersipora subatra TaxID=2589382 RepID=UPI00355B9F6B